MMNLNSDILNHIGHTPLVALQKILPQKNSAIFAKCEFLNPSGSVKDRMAKFIIEDAEKKGLIKPQGIIVENSSGNTGCSLAMIAALKGYQCIITMPDKMSPEKKTMMEAFGAEVIVTPTDVPAESSESYYSVAKRIAKEKSAFYPDQYNNPQNIEAHYRTTGPEIWQQTGGEIDILIAGIGTGGTLSGAGKYLKEQNKNIKVIGVDPMGSVFYDYFKTKTMSQPHVYKVEGIGEDYLVKALDFSILDDIIQVNDKESFLMARQLTTQEGLFVGGSSGAAMVAALKCINNLNKSQNIVVILPDSGNRYLSKIYNDQWMQKNGFL